MTTIYAAPADAFVQHATDAPVIAIKLRESGYYPIYTSATVADLNGPDVTPEIVQAAVIGSMFGWRTPGARPAVDYLTRDKN